MITAKVWNDLLASIDSLAGEAAAATRQERAHGPELPGDCPAEELAVTLGEIISHLESGHSLGLMTKFRHRRWHETIEACRVEGRVPQTIDEFRALRALARLREGRARFAGRWRRTVESLGGPEVDRLGNSPERAAQGYAAEIRKRLEWRTSVWEVLIDELRTVHFRWDDWLATHAPVSGDYGELTRIQRAASQGLAEIVEAQAALIRQNELSAALQSQRTYLAGFPQSDAASVLLTAQDNWNVEDYETTCRELARLEGLHAAYDSRSELLAKLVECGSCVGASNFSAREATRCHRTTGHCHYCVEMATVPRTRATGVNFDDRSARTARKHRKGSPRDRRTNHRT